METGSCSLVVRICPVPFLNSSFHLYWNGYIPTNASSVDDKESGHEARICDAAERKCCQLYL